MKDQNLNVINSLKNTRKSSAIGAGLGSMAAIAMPTYMATLQWSGLNWLSIIVAVLAVLLALAVVEYGMHTYFPFGIKGILSGKAFNNGWRTAALFVTITLLALSLAIASGYLSYEGRKEGGRVIAGKAETKDVTVVADKLNFIESSKLREAKKSVSEYNSKIKSRKAEIKKANANLVRLSERSNDDWAGPRLQEKIDSDNELKELKQELRQATKTRDAILKQSSVSETVSALNMENLSSIETWKDRMETSKGMIGYFGIACIVIFIISSIVIALFEIEIIDKTDTMPRRAASGPTPSEDILLVKSEGPAVARMAETALKQAIKNRDKIETIKTKEIVSETVSVGVSPEISETNRKPETKLKQKTETKEGVSETEWKPSKKDIVSKNGVNAIWVPGFKTEPFSLSQCNSKLKQYRWKVEKGTGVATAKKNVVKFVKAINYLS